MHDENIIPAPLRELLSVFATELADVKFADLDESSLTTAAAQVRERAAALAAAEAATAAARAALDQAQEALWTHGQRALAYARVFAQERPALAARLDVLAVGRFVRRPEPGPDGAAVAPRRRGRPPKNAAALPALPGVAAASEAALGGE